MSDDPTEEDFHQISNELFKELMDNHPALIAKFNEGYDRTQPKRIHRGGDPTAICSRCRVPIYSQDWSLHLLWHRRFSLAIWLLQSWALSHMLEGVDDAPAST